MSPPKVTAIDVSLVDLPTIRPHHLSMTVMRTQTMVIVRLHCSDGIVGLGEASTIGGLSYGEESPEGMKVAIETYFTPALLNQDATSIQAAMMRLHAAGKGNRFAKFALETALLDAQGKRLGVPVSTLLGGVVEDSLPVLWTLASGDTEKDIEEAQSLLQSGRHRAFKLKIGTREPAHDIAHVSAIKKAVGDSVMITTDINQAWEEAVAKPGIARLQEAGVDLIEQPLDRDNYEGLARLTSHFTVAIMADEAVTDTKQAFKLAKIFAGSVFALKPAKAGGLYEVLRVAAVAQAAGIGLYGGTMLEGTIGTAAAAHAFRTLPRLEWGTELFGPLLLTDDIIKNPIVYRDGRMHLPEGPGLGLELDMDKFEQYRRKL